MRKDKVKKNIKDFLKDIVALVCIVAVCFGGYKLYANYKTTSAQNDESYKVKTKRDRKYNGVYSLTKLDKDGKNTWDGLMLYVKNDKIVSCARVEYTPVEDIRKKLKEQLGDNFSQIDEKSDKSLEWQLNELGLDVDLGLPGATSSRLGTGFHRGGVSISSDVITSHIITVGEFVCPDKVNFDKVTDIKTDYDYMKSCLIVPAYDEESQEVWLSKLLSNEKSEYYEGYKLIHYNSENDIEKNCPLDNGECMRELNENFNAGFEVSEIL